MFKVILAAVFALGVSSFAFAQTGEPGGAGGGDKMDAGKPAADKPAPGADAGKPAPKHKGHGKKKPAKPAGE